MPNSSAVGEFRGNAQKFVMIWRYTVKKRNAYRPGIVSKNQSRVAISTYVAGQEARLVQVIMLVCFNLILTSSLPFSPLFLISMLHKKLPPVFLVHTSLSSHLKFKRKNPKGPDLKQF